MHNNLIGILQFK